MKMAHLVFCGLIQVKQFSADARVQACKSNNITTSQIFCLIYNGWIGIDTALEVITAKFHGIFLKPHPISSHLRILA
jgi:hypothetical protein